MQLAEREQVISEVPLGALAASGTLTLTDRRLVAVAPGSEESIPLAKVASIRSAFLRDYGTAVAGVIIFVLALSFASGYKSLETALNGGIYSAQRHFFEKTPEGDAYGRYINLSAGWIWLLMLPLMGLGAFKTYKGVMGETELVVGTSAGEFRRVRDGQRRDFLDFVEEAGRRLP
jgi:hypothetical protein